MLLVDGVAWVKMLEWGLLHTPYGSSFYGELPGERVDLAVNRFAQRWEQHIGVASLQKLRISLRRQR